MIPVRIYIEADDREGRVYVQPPDKPEPTWITQMLLSLLLVACKDTEEDGVRRRVGVEIIPEEACTLTS